MNILEWSLNCSSREFNLLTSDKAIELAENEECSFLILSRQKLKISLVLGDFSVDIKLVKEVRGIYYYQTKRVRYFLNFIGLVHAELFLSKETTSLVSNGINIFARKATYDRASSFLKFLSKKPDISAICFSVTKMNSDYQKGIKNLTALLSAGISVLNYFQEQQNRFSQYPCYKNVIENKVVNYNYFTPLDDRSIAYLSQNPASLSKAIESRSDLILRNQSFNINNIQVTKLKQDTNVFENQVILAFVKNFLTYLKKIKSNLNTKRTSTSDKIVYNGDDYLSIDRLLSDSGLILITHKDKIDKTIDSCQRCIGFIKNHIPCQITHGTAPKPIPNQNILAKTHYLTLFGLIDQFYKIEEFTWCGEMEFFGLRNLYKIYEFVCLVNIIESLTKLGYSITKESYIDINDPTIKRPLNEPNNHYYFEKDNRFVTLLYEPKAILVRKAMNAVPNGTLIDLAHYSNQTWSPDFVLQVEQNNSLETHIFDAKYSNLSTVQKYHIEDCILKYITKMKVYNNTYEAPYLQDVDSMNLLYSGDNNDQYESYYERSISLYSSVGVFNKNAVKPYLGMLTHNEKNIYLLNQLIKDLIE